MHIRVYIYVLKCLAELLQIDSLKMKGKEGDFFTCFSALKQFVTSTLVLPL